MIRPSEINKAATRVAAKKYVESGYTLVSWYSCDGKNPNRKGWGLAPFDPRCWNEEDMLGLNHGLSRTVCIDGDDLPLTRDVFAAYGLDVEAMPGNPPAYAGNPARRKWLYRLPDGFIAPGVRKLKSNGEVVFEIRGTSEGKQAQDVLPPSPHPEHGKYKWHTALPPRDDLPVLPDVLCDIWLNWSYHEANMKRAAGEVIEEPAKPTKPDTTRNATPVSDSKGDTMTETIDLYRRQYSVEDVLSRNGYQRKGNGRYLRPGSSTGMAGISIQDGDCGYPVAFSFGGDDLEEDVPHDAFDLMRVLEHGGDWHAAASQAENDLTMNDGRTLADHRHEAFRLSREAEEAANVFDDIDAFNIEDGDFESDPEPEAIPEIRLTGLLGSMQEYCYSNSLYPDRNASALVALTALAAICHPETRSPTGLKPSLYALVVMPTGSGKESLKKAAQSILGAVGKSNRMISLGSSKQAMHHELQIQEAKQIAAFRGLFDLCDKPADAIEAALGQMDAGDGMPTSSIAVADEFHQQFSGVNNGTNSFQRDARDFLMSMYTEHGVYMPSQAMTSNYVRLTAPCLSLLGFSTPDEMFAALGGNQVNNGLVGRLTVYATTVRPAKCYEVFDRETTGIDAVEADADVMKRFMRHGFKIDWGDGAKDAWRRIDESEIEPMKDSPSGAIANRLSEQMLKIATLLAVSDYSELTGQALVSVGHINQAWEITQSLHRSFMQGSDERGGLGATDIKKAERDVIKAIQRWVVKRDLTVMPHKNLCENCTSFRLLERRHQDDVIDQLESYGYIRMVKHGRGKSYHWLGKLPKKGAKS